MKRFKLHFRGKMNTSRSLMKCVGNEESGAKDDSHVSSMCFWDDAFTANGDFREAEWGGWSTEIWEGIP